MARTLSQLDAAVTALEIHRDDIHDRLTALEQRDPQLDTLRRLIDRQAKMINKLAHGEALDPTDFF